MSRPISPQDEGRVLAIQGLVAHVFGLRTEEMSSGRQERAVTLPRQIAMYLAKHETHISLANIGRLFGGKHHTTVLHALDRVEALRREDAATYRLIESVRRNLTLGWSQE